MSVATVDPHSVSDAVAGIRQRLVELAGDRSVHLIAVTKGFGADAIVAARAAGCSMIGENYAQELLGKLAELDANPELVSTGLPEMHFIGRLQTNKVRLLVGHVDVWQSVDRASLVDEIARRAPGARVFVQVNATADVDKGGCAVSDVDALVQRCRLAGLDVVGLMTVGPTDGDPAETNRVFGFVRHLADDCGLAACSMGMSADMAAAVENGATHVRIGSAIFGTRPHPLTRIR